MNWMEIILARDLSFGFSLWTKSKPLFIHRIWVQSSIDILPQNLITVSLVNDFRQSPNSENSQCEKIKKPRHNTQRGRHLGFTYVQIIY
jgi:hypothetical protein